MEKLFNELGFEYLADRRWFRKLSFFYNIHNNSAPSYLHDIIPRLNSYYNTRNQPSVLNFTTRTELFSFSFFPYTIRTWNSLDPSIRNLTSLSLFKKALLKFIRPTPTPLYGIHHPVGMKLVTRLRMGLSHLRQHKFRHNFCDTINPLCPCNTEPETTDHYLLRCHFFSAYRKVLFDSLKNIGITLTAMNDESKLKTLLYGSTNFSSEINSSLINALIKFIISSGRFEGNLI